MAALVVLVTIGVVSVAFQRELDRCEMTLLASVA
jgi:hypothetical protein